MFRSALLANFYRKSIRQLALGRRRTKVRLDLQSLEGRDVPSVTVNFDSIAASGVPGGVGGALLADYLSSYGITLTSETPGTQVVVEDARDIYAAIQPVVPPSPFNVITQGGTNDPVSYTLNFDQLQDSFSMTRPYIRSGVTGVALPEWHAYAFDASGNLLSSVGENAFSIFSDLPEEQFTLGGPGIKSVTIASDNHHFAAFSAAILDDFVLSNVVQPDIAATSLDWNSAQGGIDFAYVVNDSALTVPAKVGLYWSPSEAFDSQTATLAYETTIDPAQGEHGPFHVALSVLGQPPDGSTHLLMVLDAAQDVQESNENNNDMALAIPDVPSFSDGFEGSVLDPFWTKTENSGFVTMPSTDQAHGGSQSVQFTSTNTADTKNIGLTHTFVVPVYGKVSVWLYDTGADQSSSNQFWFGIGNSATGQGALLAAADYNTNEGTQYYYDVNGDSTHIVDRSVAWHQFTIDSKPTGLTLQIDGQTVYSNSDSSPFDSLSLRMLAPSWRPAVSSYWDDFVFQQYSAANTAPVVDAGATRLSSAAFRCQAQAPSPIRTPTPGRPRSITATAAAFSRST